MIFKNSCQNINDLISLHSRAFGEGMNEELWNWKYSFNSKYIVGIENGKPVAFYGCIGRKIYIFGKAYGCANICDTMVDPSKRGAFSKKGVFFNIANSFITQFTGKNKGFEFCYGFPSARHAKLGKILGLYEEVDSLNQLLWLGKDKKELFFKLEKITKEEALKRVEELFKEMKKDFKNYIIGSRESQFFEYRYLKHPQFNYKFYALKNRLNKKISAIAITKEENNGGLEILDIIGPKKYFKKSVELIRGLREYKYFFIWCSPIIEKLFSNDYEKKEVCKICVTTHSLPYKIEEIKGKFAMMGGESDFR